ncbi:putative arginine--tRNA ligase, cytoplasmic [Aphelenchoides fujianensis]|nr:putative arginine--tRNA ligase, cytoplasmic [Aphelenchoides fujianensis]
MSSPRIPLSGLTKGVKKKITDLEERIEAMGNAEKKKSPPKEQKPAAVKYVRVLDYGHSILERLVALFGQTVKQVAVQLRETTDPQFGEYQFDSCPLIAKKLADAGVRLSPAEVAARLMAALPRLTLQTRAEGAEFFINVFLMPHVVGQRLATAFKQKASSLELPFGIVMPKLEPRLVCIDFSSPNIAKKLDVNHLRSTIIGESMARLLEFVGYDVRRINHIGDWGTQFGMLIAHLQDRFPDFARETPPLADLQAFYKESKKRFDEDEAFKERAYECVVRLQNHDPEFIAAWKLICDVSRADFHEIYRRLGVRHNEHEDRFGFKALNSVVQLLEERKLLVEEDGRKLFFPDGASAPLTLVKADGGFTYDTSDLATIQHRLLNYGPQWLLYVVDAGQAAHFETIFAAARHLGWYEREKTRVEHVQVAVVLGEDKKKFKTRSGKTARFTDLLDEGVRCAEVKLLETKRAKASFLPFLIHKFSGAKEAIAYGCIRYEVMKSARVSDYVFSFDRMLDVCGNTAVYLLYAHARICSIIRTAGVDPQQMAAYVNALPNGVLPLEHPAELKLGKQLLRFPDVLLTVLESLQLHKLCDYVYQLAASFQQLYLHAYRTPPMGTDGLPIVNENHLVLCSVADHVMGTCFKILGIRPLEKM